MQMPRPRRLVESVPRRSAGLRPRLLGERPAAQRAAEPQRPPATVRAVPRRWRPQGRQGRWPAPTAIVPPRRGPGGSAKVLEARARQPALSAGVGAHALARLRWPTPPERLDAKTGKPRWPPRPTPGPGAWPWHASPSQPPRAPGRRAVLHLSAPGGTQRRRGGLWHVSRPPGERWRGRGAAAPCAGLRGPQPGPPSPRQGWGPRLDSSPRWGLPSLEAAGPRGSRGAAGRPSLAGAVAPAAASGGAVLGLSTAWRRAGVPAGVLADRGGACTAHACAAGGTRVQMAHQPRERTPGARALPGMAPPGHGPRRLGDSPGAGTTPPGADARGPQPLSEPSQTPAPQGLLHDPCDPPLPLPGLGEPPAFCSRSLKKNGTTV